MNLRRRRAGAAVISGVAALALLEFLARTVFWKETDAVFLKAQLELTSLAAFTRPSADGELLYELKPGADVVGAGVRVKIDPSGCCRIVPGAAPREAGLKIAIIGDSSPFGWGLPFEKSYGEELAVLSKATVRNFSVPGYNSLQNRVALRDKVLPWKPGLVILHYDHNDSDRITDKPPDYLDPAYGDNGLHSMLVKFVRRRLRRWANLRNTEPKPGSGERFFLSYRYSGPQFEKHMEEMRRIAELAKVSKTPVVVFIFNPWLRRFSDPRKDPFYTLLHKPVAERLRAFGFRVVDCYEPFQAYMRRTGADDLGALWLSRDPLDGHPNARGHRVIAEILSAALSRR